MLKYRPAIVLGGLACLLSFGGAATPAHADVQFDRWASPDGTDAATCTQSDPCDIVTAINDAAPSSVVHVESGTYGTADSPLTTQLEADDPITIEAATPVDPPVIISNASGGSSLVTYQSVVSDLVIMSSSASTGLALLDGSSASRVATYAVAGTSGACSVYASTLTDSICAQTADGAAAIGLGITGTGTTSDTFINVTAVSTGLHSIGVDSVAAGGLTFNLNFTNSIIQGKQHDLRLTASDGATSKATTDHSLYRPTTVATTGATVVSDPSDVQGKAKFVDVAAADFHEKHTSSSVDAGGTAAMSDADLAGNPRTLGRAPDIGAYELVERPHVGPLKVTGVVRRTATFTVSVNPEGLDTRVVLVARHKLHKVKSRVAEAGDGREPTKLTVSFVLDPATKYHVRARATSRAGVTQSNNTHFMT